jgi:hypothetical protein
LKLKQAAPVQVPIATRTQSGMYEEFTGELKALLRRRRDDLDKDVLAGIRERTGLPLSDARKLLREYVEATSSLPEESATV